MTDAAQAITVNNVADALRDKVADRIKIDFVELIPEDVWKKMVQVQINWFMRVPDRSGYYRDRESASPLQELIRSALVKEFTAAVTVEMKKPEYSGDSTWGENGQQFSPSEFTKAFIRENLGVIMEAAVGSLMQASVEKFKQTMQQGY